MTSTLGIAGLFYGFAGGLAIGLLFFQGLKMTVERLGDAQHPARLVLLSMLLRFGLAMTALYLLARSANPWLLLAVVAGFALARAVVLNTRLNRRTPPAGTTSAEKGGPAA